MGSIGTLLTGKTCAQSEPDITSAVAARAAKWGIAANGLTQKNALRVRRRLWPLDDSLRRGHKCEQRGRESGMQFDTNT